MDPALHGITYLVACLGLAGILVLASSGQGPRDKRQVVEHLDQVGIEFVFGTKLTQMMMKVDIRCEHPTKNESQRIDRHRIGHEAPHGSLAEHRVAERDGVER